MSKKGQDNISGIEAQQWAALSLFLQHLSSPLFDHVELEPPDFHDFNLVFTDGHKIVCESKYHKQAFNYSDLKGILKSTNAKHEINEKDTILIVCKNLSASVASSVKMIRYFPEKYKKEFSKKRFSIEEIELLPHVNFWGVSAEFNKNVCCALLADYIDYWMPPEDLLRFIEALKQQFNEAASKGSAFSRAELREQIEKLKNEIVKKTGHYDTEKRKTEKIVKELVKALRNNENPIWAQYNISALSAQPHLLHFVFQRLKKITQIDLRKWNDLWNLNRFYGFSFNVFRIFSNNLHSLENRQYVLEYVKNNVASLRGFYRLDFFIIEAVNLIKKIVSADESLLKEAFKAIKSLLADLADEILYVKNNKDRDYQKEQIADVLRDIFDKADKAIQGEIIDYVSNTFDLVRSHRETPGAIYSIINKHLVSDWRQFPLRFKELTKLLIRQYGKFFEGKLHNGWDHIGSTGSFMGRDYRVSDRDFVEIILKPVFDQFYRSEPQKAWQLVKKYCVTPRKKVSKNRPDFLNRSVIPIVLDQFKHGTQKAAKEAFEILREFILSSQGIPVKFELIYQTIRGDDFTDDQKWKLIKVSIRDKYGKLPITPFVEQIVTQLAKKGHPEARTTLAEWFENQKYFKAPKMLDYAIPNIEAFLNCDLSLAVSLFKKFIGNEEFIHKKDEFDTYDAAEVLQNILQKDYSKGMEILNNLLLIENPTVNQQILISHGFFSHREPNEKQDQEPLLKIFNDYVRPNLKRFKDFHLLTHSHSRASFLQFGRVLAISELVSEALEIVKAFIDDPDPYLPGKDPEDPENKYNEHKHIGDGKEPHAITSVRGWCAWVLASCPAMPSRDFVPEILEMTSQLLKDPNWYVKHMTCFSLNQLARNRLSVMPPERKNLYLNDDKSRALQMAKAVESMAFKLLEAISDAPENVQKALAKSVLSPFEHIRALNQKDAERFLDIIRDSAVPLQAQVAPFLIYLAEFRKSSSAYKKWPWQVSGYYDDLEVFDDTRFKHILKKWVVKGPTEVRTQLSWELWALVQKAYQDKIETHFPIAFKYLELASQNYEHGVFENIYRFIDDRIESYFEECFSLWKTCLATEKTFFEKDFDPYKMHWWPHHYNGRILLQIRKQLGDAEFVKWLEFLSSYPEGSRLEDLRVAVELLVNMPSQYDQNIKKIFDHLINRRKELSYCDLKDAWKSRSRKKSS